MFPVVLDVSVMHRLDSVDRLTGLRFFFQFKYIVSVVVNKVNVNDD